MTRLKWTADHTTEWNGTSYELHKRPIQDDKGRWGKPSWYLYKSEPLVPQSECSPVMGTLGRRLDTAKKLAELHLIGGWEYAFQHRPSDGMELWRNAAGELRPLDELLAEQARATTKES